jgi:hypothetical protein
MKVPVTPQDGIKARGFYRLQITEGEKVVGDSGWKENLITNLGFLDFIVGTMGGLSGSSQVSHLALGTGGAPIATDTTLAGEVVKRQAVTAASSSSSKAVSFTGTFSSSNSFVTNTQNVSNIGLFATSSGGTLMAGNTFASSSVATNQNVNATYVVAFS